MAGPYLFSENVENVCIIPILVSIKILSRHVTEKSVGQVHLLVDIIDINDIIDNFKYSGFH